MKAFRVLLLLIFIALSTYTAIVIYYHGRNLLPIFFGDMAKIEWPGQFNLDFMCFLALSALWVSWRHKFSIPGLLLGLVAFFGGALFLSAYLFVESFKVNNSIQELILGTNRL